MTNSERVTMRTMGDACHNPHNYKNTRLVAKFDKGQWVAYENDGEVKTTTVASIADAVIWFKTKDMACSQ